MLTELNPKSFRRLTTCSTITPPVGPLAIEAGVELVSCELQCLLVGDPAVTGLEIGDGVEQEVCELSGSTGLVAFAETPFGGLLVRLAGVGFPNEDHRGA